MKTSILEQFANDVINAPAAVTGGSGKCGCGTKAKSKKAHKSGSNKSGSNKSGSGKSGGTKGGGGCLPPRPKNDPYSN